MCKMGDNWIIRTYKCAECSQNEVCLVFERGPIVGCLNANVINHSVLKARPLYIHSLPVAAAVFHKYHRVRSEHPVVIETCRYSIFA